MTSTEREAVHRARSAVASALSAADFSTSREDGCGLPGVGLPFPLPPDPSPRSGIIER